MADVDDEGPRLDRAALEQLLAGLTAVRGGDFSTRLAPTGDPLVDEIAAVFNRMVDQLDQFTSEVTRVAREVGAEGKLGGQATVHGVSGTWKDLVGNVNELAGNLTRQVRAISEVTSAVAAGDMTRTISVEAAGEVAGLKDSINAMVRSLREAEQASHDQDWLKTNLTSIGSMLQGHRDLEVVAELIMEEIAPLLGAQHGTFFLNEGWNGERQLRLIAGYGLHAELEAPLQYRIGQSLIGQVAKSKRPVVVDRIPQGYIKISSGLGDAAPASLAIMPVMFENEVLGVVELASFSRFTPIQIAFLEQFAETLGISVNALIANSRTDALLAESQRLTAELQARSEELQRSNADLKDKAELLKAQKQDIEAKNSEIERARGEIEERDRQLTLASQYKSQFLANMSHELRTPLNSLLILARLLAQNPGRNLTAKQVEYANVIHSAGSDLLQLITSFAVGGFDEVSGVVNHASALTAAADPGPVAGGTDSSTGAGPTPRNGTARGSGAPSGDGDRPPRNEAQDRKVLVFEPTSGGLLTLLAHSAASDLAQLSAPVRVCTATTPEQGIAMLAAEPFRCVVVDLGLPAALEFLDRVRDKPGLREVPALAHVPGESRGGGHNAGQHGRLARLRADYPSLEVLPSLDDLRERITLHLSAARPGRVPALVAPSAVNGSKATALDDHPGLRGKHVLVIDDDARNVFAIASTLELHGLRVTQAGDGGAGIDALRAAPDTDLILMDVMMPGMDGYATMAAIRQMPQFRQLPIIAVTARAMPGDREKSIAAGASDYVTKPVDTEELLVAMEKWLTAR